MEGGLYSAAHTSVLLKVCVQPPLPRRIHHRSTLKTTAAGVAPAAIPPSTGRSHTGYKMYIWWAAEPRDERRRTLFWNQTRTPSNRPKQSLSDETMSSAGVIKALLCNRGTVSESQALKWLRINSRATKRLHWWPLFCVISKREIRTARCWWAVWGTIWSTDRRKRGNV